MTRVVAAALALALTAAWRALGRLDDPTIDPNGDHDG